MDDTAFCMGKTRKIYPVFLGVEGLQMPCGVVVSDEWMGVKCELTCQFYSCTNEKSRPLQLL